MHIEFLCCVGQRELSPQPFVSLLWLHHVPFTAYTDPPSSYDGIATQARCIFQIVLF